MQQIWQCSADWDDPLPTHISTLWHSFYEALPVLTQIRIPRWLGTSPSTLIEIHGFSDASKKAYAAVVYLRVVDASELCQTRLIMSKTRVAPLKQLSIPRLELSGAVLLANLIMHVRRVPALATCKVQPWTDSTIVLDWLGAQSSQWKVFVANRVADIHTSLPNVSWRHVPGTDNPADLASRGVSSTDLLTSSLWWHGPAWLSQPASQWPELPSLVDDTTILERRSVTHHGTVETDHADVIFRRFSCWLRLRRVLSCVLSLSKYWRAEVARAAGTSTDLGSFSHVTIRIYSLLQAQAFSRELHILKNNTPDANGARYLDIGQTLPRDSQLKRLSPLLDKDGLLRVGGRLELAHLPYEAKHPAILPSGHIASLLTVYAHGRCLHGGVNLTLSTLRQQVWVLQARKTVRSVIARCVKCARHRAETPTQLMGSLPSVRVNPPPRAFTECGVDYAGPVRVRLAGGRGHQAHSAYIAVFICMATRAIHLELVSDYSTPAFLAAFQRFYSRRGLPHTVFSDCGTNFDGADRELRAAYQAANTSDDLRARVASDGVTWKFIPPAAPHFGAMWEAGVRSMKWHLKRILEPHTPTFEELVTLLCRVEACLNSRPLAPLTDDTESLDTLTPGHFLIGAPLLSHPSPLTVDYACRRATRWRLYQQLLERFWTYWSRDYVTSCQHRSKWLSTSPSIKPGQIVLLRNDQLPPAKWDLARIVACHPGHDGLVRVVTLRTAYTTLKRPICKLALLPIDIDDVPKLASPTSS